MIKVYFLPKKPRWEIKRWHDMLIVCMGVVWVRLATPKTYIKYLMWQSRFIHRLTEMETRKWRVSR